MKIWNAVLAGLSWVWSYFVWAWNWLEDKNYDPPPVSLKKMFYGVLATVGFGVWIGYALFHSPMKIPAADKFVSALPEPVKLVAVPVTEPTPPVPVAATPLPCVPVPAAQVLNPAKKVARKATVKNRLTVRKPAAPKEAVYTIYWGF